MSGEMSSDIKSIAYELVLVLVLGLSLTMSLMTHNLLLFVFL